MAEWTAQQDVWLRELYPDTSNKVIAKMLGRSYSAIKNRAVTLGLKKSGEYMATGPGCFTKESAPWNKGRNWNAGGRSVATQFKAGEKPHTWVPVGTEVVDAYGYRKRKVRDDAPKGRAYRNWKFVHIIVWEESNGCQLPKGHIVRFKDGDIQNLDPTNLVALSRAENAVINRWLKMGDLPEGGLDVLITMAKLLMAARNRKEELEKAA